MKENKVRELQSQSLQQPTGHRIVVESPRQSVAKKKKKVLSLAQDSWRSLDCNGDSVLYMTRDSKPCAHGRDSANDTKSKFNSYLYWQVPNT